MFIVTRREGTPSGMTTQVAIRLEAELRSRWTKLAGTTNDLTLGWSLTSQKDGINERQEIVGKPQEFVILQVGMGGFVKNWSGFRIISVVDQIIRGIGIFVQPHLDIQDEGLGPGKCDVQSLIPPLVEYFLLRWHGHLKMVRWKID